MTGTQAFGFSTAFVVWNSNPDESGVGPSDEYLEVTPTGLVNHGNTAGEEVSLLGLDIAALIPTYTEVPFPIDGCGSYLSFNVPAHDTGIDYYGDGGTEKVAVRATTTLRIEDVTVPVGEFPNALHVVRDVRITLIDPNFYSNVRALQLSQRYEDWYAAGVGPIKRTTDDGTATHVFDLIAYSVAGISHGVMPPTALARDLPLIASDPFDQNRPTIGFDGSNFLVAAPTSTSYTQGGLQGIVVAPDGTPASSAPLLESSTPVGTPVVAFDGTRYLIAYTNLFYGRVEVIAVSPAGATLNGPMVVSNNIPVTVGIQESSGAPAVVTTNMGFLVGYIKNGNQAGTSVPNLWLAPVDVHGQAIDHVEPFPDRAQDGVVTASDGNTILALWTELRTLIYGARIDATGHPVDAVPFLVSSAPADRVGELALIFDGTQFVATWVQTRDTKPSLRVARIGVDTLLRDGPASAGGVSVGDPNTVKRSARIARLGAGSLIIWERAPDPADLTYSLTATRFTADGRLLDAEGGVDGQQVLTSLANAGFSRHPLAAIAWGRESALVVWTYPASDSQPETRGLDSALAYPW